MPSTYSTSMRFELIATGEQSGTWGGTTNTNVGTLLEQAIGGYQQVAMTDANYTLTTANGAPDEARNMVLRITGTLSAQRNVSCPSGIEKLYLVENATTGGFAIVFKTASGTGVTIPNGSTSLVYANGTNVVEVIQSPVPVALGGTGATSAANARTNLGLGTAAVQNTGTSGATVPLLNGSNTWSTSQTFSAINTFGSGAAGVDIVLNGAAGTGRQITYRTNGLNRWIMLARSGPETGANAGSNFAITSYDDAGNYIEDPLVLTRATGAISIKSLFLTNDLAVTEGGTGASDAATARTNLGLGSISTQAANSVSITGGSISGITDLAVADGGTGASDAAGARTNLGLGTISTQDSNNVSITGGAISGVTISGITDIAIADGGTGASDAATARTNLGLVIGTNVQAYDATLQSISGLGTAADRFAYTTGVDTWAEATITAAGRAILDDANAAAQLATLGAAPLTSPTFTGTPAAPTASSYTNTTQIATTAEVYGTVTTVPENAQTGTTYTLALADAGKMVTLTNAGAITLTIPLNSSVAFPVNTRIDIAQGGAGQVTVSATAGVTLLSSASRVKITGQYSGATLWKQATNTWWLIGDIS